VPACNSLGLGLIGVNRISDALDALKNGSADTVIILENDLYRNFDAQIADEIFNTAKNVIVLDSLENKTTAKANFVLPAATFAESDGTLVNNEGRAQRFFKVYMPPEPAEASWRWLSDMMDQRWRNFDDITKDLAEALPVFKSICDAAPPADFRIEDARIPRQPHRYSGRTAIMAKVNVHEAMPPVDKDSPLAFSMEGYEGQPPSPLISRFWSPKWNSVQSVNKFQKEVGGELRGGDPGKRLLEPQTTASPQYFTHIPAAFEPRDGELFIVPAYHVFGSDELSILSPGIAERAPKPYIAINAYDANVRGIHEGDILEVRSYRLPAMISASLARGLAAVPYGLPDLPWPDMPFWWKIPDMKGKTQ
jgi:NADH-quinone oxidoreductase subunit G